MATLAVFTPTFISTREEVKVAVLAAEGISIFVAPVRWLSRRLGSLVLFSICEAQALMGWSLSK